MRYLSMTLICLGLGAATPAAAQTASSQSNAERLGNCLVSKTTGEDRILSARWILAAMASAPQVADVAHVEPAKKEEIDRAMARLFTRLMTKDCLEEARPLLLARDGAGARTAGEALGRIAMQELLSDPKAVAAVAKYATYIDYREFEVFMPGASGQ